MANFCQQVLKPLGSYEWVFCCIALESWMTIYWKDFLWEDQDYNYTKVDESEF